MRAIGVRKAARRKPLPRTLAGVHVETQYLTTTPLPTFEAFARHQAAILGCFVGHTTWDDYSAYWLGETWQNFTTAGSTALPRQLHISFPLLMTDDTLAEAANGDFDAEYTDAATEIRDWGLWPGTTPIYIRVGWEFNQDLFPWYASGATADYIATFRRFVNAFRAVSGRFRFEWCPNIGNNGTQIDPDTCYPGNDYVDVVGLDCYYLSAFDNADAATAFISHRDRDYGLQWHVDYAASKGKPPALSEWGANADKELWTRLMCEWVKKHNYLWQMWWDRDDGGFDTKISDGSFSGNGNAYKAAFGLGATK